MINDRDKATIFHTN